MPTAKLPHILIIMPDQCRADSLRCAGHPQIKTPNMDRLAADGMRFTQAYTVSPICMPARASFVNGLYPHNHGMWTNAGQMPADDETFFHHLQAAGYYTAHIGKSHYYPHGGKHLREYEPYMHARGLDYVHETTGPLATVRTDSYLTDRWRRLGLLEKYRDDYARRRATDGQAVWPSPLPVEEFPDSYVGRQAVEFVEKYEGNRPVCLFVGFGGPHSPWDAPGDYATMYDPADTPAHVPPAEPEEWVPEHAARKMTAGRHTRLADHAIGRLRANYYGKISLIDHWVGQILAAFERREWLSDTLVVFWSDHGEMAGDHQRVGKCVFYDASVRVPLIVRWPGHIEPGRTSDALVEIIDVFPTLLDAVGAEPSARCFGKSLWPVLRDPNSEHRDAVFSEIHHGGQHNIMVLTRGHKYAMDETGSGYLLHDVLEDPAEQHNIIGHPESRELEDELRARVLRFLVHRQCLLR